MKTTRRPLRVLSRTLRFAVLLGASVCCVAAANAQNAAVPAVSLESLLNEATNRAAVATAPNFVCKQASSFDRAAKSPEENWFANADTAQFIRVEKNGDREEAVLMEADGPGAIVRWWITAPHYKNNVYIYIDGATEPTVSGNFADIVGGDALVGAPLSAERARGRNLYLPIPYAKSVKVTCDKMAEQGNLYYQINYRTYPKETVVESFSLDALDAQKEKIAAVGELLLNPSRTTFDGVTPTQGFKRYIPSEMTEGLFGAHRIAGPGAITEIAVRLIADDVANASRNVVLSISFDGEETVWVPVGEFFGSGVGVNPHKTWYTTVEKDGTMKAFWRMPFQKEARVSFVNLGAEDVDVDYSVYYQKSPWTEKSTYFHADWRQERKIETLGGQGTKDWNYVTIKGRGVYVGDVLSVVNAVPEWWGEGDEKIYVDGETFPSHFGTGTEDYYGYAWCAPEFFEAPFHAQPRAEGPQNFGNTTNLRFRSLDGIPFEKEFRFDMEIWHWAATTVDYSVTTFWYGAPGAELVDAPDRSDMEDEASEPVEYDRVLKMTFSGFESADGATGGRVAVQNMKEFEKNGFQWVDERQFWWSGAAAGDKTTLRVPNVPAGKKSIVLGATIANDYGIAQFYWNGEKIGSPIDFYNAPKVARRVVQIAVPETVSGDGTLEVEIVGKNENSRGTMFGIDSVEWK